MKFYLCTIQALMMHIIRYFWIMTLISVASVLSASAQTKNGVATHFEALGTPYGGCGVPQELLETQNFVALNVFDTPGNYATYPRPLTGANTQYLGEFNNGLNCGRWLKVTMGPNCQGTNDGARNQPFCRGANAQWVDDKYSGAVLYMLVADACGDDNAWCRDSPYHLDMATVSVNQFEKNGIAVGDMLPNSFNNRQIDWEYVSAPDYTGDIDIYFIKGAEQYWPAIMINHLPNGIHGVEQKVGNQWVKAAMNSDLGQHYILPNTTAPYRIRVIDADDQLLFDGKEYVFSLPTACKGKCTEPATLTNYQTVTDLYNTSDLSNRFYFTVEEGVLIAHRRQLAGGAEVSFIVYDLQGKEKLRKEDVASGYQAFALGSIPQGTYLIVMKSQAGQTFTQKILY